MEELLDIYAKAEKMQQKLIKAGEEFSLQLHIKLWGESATPSIESNASAAFTRLPSVSPRQTTKRIKRLSSLQEDESEDLFPVLPSKGVSGCLSKRSINLELLATAATINDIVQTSLEISNGPEVIPATPTLMLPPAPPMDTTEVVADHSFARPQRAAKLKSEKNLKEPTLNRKMRRPSILDTTKVKLEHEQRPSQIDQTTVLSLASSNPSMTSTESEDSVLLVPGKAPSIVELMSGDEAVTNNDEGRKKSEKGDVVGDTGARNLRIRIKREKGSLSGETKGESTFVAPAAVPKPKVLAVKNETMSDESTVASSTALSASTSTITTSTSGSVAPAAKKTRKKKDAVPKPIKVERFSEIEGKTSPVALRTRKGSNGRDQPQQESRAPSIYEDAVDTLSTNLQSVGVTAEGIVTHSTRAPKASAEVAAAVADNCANPNETVTIATDKHNDTVFLGDTTSCANPAQTAFQVAPEQSTFVVQNPNSTVTLAKQADSVCGMDVGDATFNVAPTDVADKDGAQQQHPSFASSKQSMETARDTSQPQNDTLIIEESCFDLPIPQCELPMSKAPLTKVPISAKSCKMTTRTNELFNPLIQSPVKMKVKAFENAVNAANSTDKKKPSRPKRTKENSVPVSAQSTVLTPSIGKMHAPALGRFLTPTQVTNITPNAMAQVKKGPNSASKAVPFPKSTATSITTNLRSTNSSSNKTLSRENSADDFRKGLHLMAEERKKQREQKHLLAAQQREAKERERAERMAKLAKEREDKRLKKQMEAEQKRRELEEIQRKLRQQEEVAATAAAEAAKLKVANSKAITDQERQLLQQMKQQSGSAKNRMLPPPPKLQSKYTFEMLHEDDSTDEESKTTYKRPPPPTWSRSNVRGDAILRQQYWPTDIIDSFFSVQPMTPDLKLIFPNIDARHLKRNSSVLWSTPPRYSELPKY